MRNFFANWLNRYLGDEEAVLLMIIVLVSLTAVWFMGHILAPVLASLIIAYLLHGPVTFMANKGLGRNWAVAITYALFIGVLATVVLFLIPLTLKELRSILVDMPAIVAQGKVLLASILDSGAGVVSDELLDSAVTQVNQLALANGEKFVAYSLGRIPGLMSLSAYAVLIIMMVFFFLKDFPLLGKRVKSFLPTRRGAMRTIWVEMDLQLANYLRGKALEILIVGSVSYVVFSLFGLSYSLLLAVIVGLSVVIPFVGAFAVTIPVALVAFFQWGWEGTTLYLLLSYLVIQILDGNVLVPILFSETVNLPALVIIVSILVFGSVWGVWGVFFAIPLATLIKALMNAWPISPDLPNSALVETEQIK